MKLSLLWVAGAAVGVAAVLFVAGLDGGLPVLTQEVRQADLSAWVAERGRTRLPAAARYTVSTPLAGRFAVQLVEPGDRVEAGEALASMDVADLESSLASSRAKLAELDAQLVVHDFDKLERTALGEAEDMLEAMEATTVAVGEMVKATETRHEFAAWWQAAAKKLAESNTLPERELREANAQAAEAEVTWSAARSLYTAVQVLDQISHLGPTYVAQYIERKTLERAVLVAQRDQVHVAVETAERDLERARTLLESPLSGVVLSRHAESEQVLPAGTPLVEVGDLGALEVVSDVLTDEVTRIEVGDPVEIRATSMTEARALGHVTRIEPEGFTKLSSLGVEEQRVRVVASFDRSDPATRELLETGLGVGFQVHVRFVTESRESVLCIPRTAASRAVDGSWRVFVARGGRAELVPVELGIANDSQVEVKRGLVAGDRVVLSPPASLEDGARIAADPD